MEKMNKCNPARIYVSPAFKKQLQIKAIEETGGNVIELTRRMSSNNGFDEIKPTKNKNDFKMWL